MATRERPTLKQERFARAYVVEGNGAEAAIKAGYKVKSRTVASAIATENLQNPIVQREVESWQLKLQRAVLPSLETIEKWRDQESDPRISLAAARDLLNRAGIGKQVEAPRSVVAVFAQMDEQQLIEKMAQIMGNKTADTSPKMIDASHNIPCATPEKTEGVPGIESPSAG